MRAAQGAGRSVGADRASAKDSTNTPILARTGDLFDTCAVPLGTWPNPESLEGRFLARLLRGGEITSRDWLIDVHSMRLATEAHQLRTLGWSVRTRRVTVPTGDRGRSANIASYSLNAHQRKAALDSHQAPAFLEAVTAVERGPA